LHVLTQLRDAALRQTAWFFGRVHYGITDAWELRHPERQFPLDFVARVQDAGVKTFLSAQETTIRSIDD
jgi:hypothetical protein